MAKHEVVVGNIGTVHSSNKSGLQAYLEYRKLSKDNYGRAAGEDVTWFIDDEPRMEHIGSLTEEENREEDESTVEVGG